MVIKMDKIELFGLPGSGKSTLCSFISDKYHIPDIMYKYKNKFFYKINFHLFQYTFFFDKGLRKKYSEINNILNLDSKKNYSNVIDANISISKYIKYALFVYNKELKMKSLIIDEGTIHYTMVLYAEFNVPYEKCEKILNLLKKDDVTYIGLDTNFTQILSNIEKRNRHNTPIDFLKTKELEKILKKYQEYFNYMSLKYQTISYDEIVKYMEET